MTEEKLAHGIYARHDDSYDQADKYQYMITDDRHIDTGRWLQRDDLFYNLYDE
jgi:hypothetical protein